MSKIDVINLLKSKEVRKIVILRHGQAKKFKEEQWKMNDRSGRYKEELRIFVESRIKQCPDLQKTLLEKLFQRKLFEAKLNVLDFHYFILTPPYRPQLQLIELIGSYVRRYVAK